MDESLARTSIKLTIPGIGEAYGELNRLTAPLTVKEVIKRLPINGRIHSIRGGVSMILGLKKGTEKPVRNADIGTITYWPRGDALQIYYSDTRTRGPVNEIGTITENLTIFKEIELGSRIIIEKVNRA